MIGAGEELIGVVRREKDAVAFALGAVVLNLAATLDELLGDGEKDLFDAAVILGRHLGNFDDIPREAEAKRIQVGGGVATGSLAADPLEAALLPKLLGLSPPATADAGVAAWLDVRWNAARREADPIAREPRPLSRDEGRVGEPGLPSETLAKPGVGKVIACVW